MASPPLYRNGGENQSSLLSLSLSLHLRSPFAYMRLHYLRSASLRALAGPYTHSVAPSDRPPTSLRPPTSPYQTCSPSLLHPRRVVAPRVPNPTTATLRNFISYASLIIRRSFTRFHTSPPSFLFFPPSYRSFSIPESFERNEEFDLPFFPRQERNFNSKNV